MKLFPLDFDDCKNVMVVPAELYAVAKKRFSRKGIRVVKCDALEPGCVMADPELFDSIKELQA